MTVESLTRMLAREFKLTLIERRFILSSMRQTWKYTHLDNNWVGLQNEQTHQINTHLGIGTHICIDGSIVMFEKQKIGNVS